MLRIQGNKISNQEINNLRIFCLDDKSYRIINLETEIKINNVHPYIVNFINYYQKNNGILLNTDETFFDKYIQALYEEDLKRMTYIGNFLKLNIGSNWNETKVQLQYCQIHGVIRAFLDHYCVTIYNQKFNFKSWKYDGYPYFKKWMQKNQLILMENVIEYQKL